MKTCHSLMALLAALSACHSGLTSAEGWESLRQRALTNRCDPYFSRPFSRADQIDVVVIARAEQIRYDLREEHERKGEYIAVVETVLFGRFEQATLAVPFHWQEDALGHVCGNDVPLGRSMLYLKSEQGDGHELLRDFPCD